MLPHPLSLPLRYLPDAVQAEVLSRVFNHLLRGQTIAARLPELNGKSLCIRVNDTASEIHFRIAQGRLQAAAPGHADVCISGTVRDFWLLASRREDPDTLFFSRRLCIEGDTETGLHVKNLLDALDYDGESHFRAVLGETLGTTAFSIYRRTFGQHFTR